MTLTEFKDWALEQGSVDYDKAFNAQCVDLIRFYINKVFELPQPKPPMNAKDFWFRKETDEVLKTKFVGIPNLRDTLPEKGDIVIWNAHEKNGYCGHIGIVLDATLLTMTILEQNYIPYKVGLRADNYQNCLGFLRRK